ncbi:hypothetical protein H4Q26_010391 [Puccinia striiformis f. sp. tritici PST-130]|nr:hypothetical protein H4Q26_010391 [Puccinia striiformis f. sp. tritici PST-130]
MGRTLRYCISTMEGWTTTFQASAKSSSRMNLGKKFSNGRGNDYYVYTRRGVVYKWAAGQELDLSFARSDPWMLVSKTKLDTPSKPTRSQARRLREWEADQITGEEITRMGRVESFKPAEAQTYIPPADGYLNMRLQSNPDA